VPVAAVVPEVRSTLARPRFDFAGACWLFVTIAAVLSAPTWAGNFGIDSPYALATIAVGVVGLFMLWRIGLRAEAPVVDVHILEQRAFALPSAIYWLHILAFSGVLYSLAFFVSDRPGGSATQFGLVSLALFGGSMIAAPLAGRLIDRTDPRNVIISALLLTVGVLLLLTTIRIDTPLWLVMLIAHLLGIMMGANTPAAMKIALGAVPREKMGAGTGLISMLRDLGAPTGSAFALAVFGTVLRTQTQAAARMRAEAEGLGADLQEALATAVATQGRTVEPALQEQLRALGMELDQLLRLAGHDGLSAALPSVGYLLTAVVALALVLSLFLQRSTPRVQEAEGPATAVDAPARGGTLSGEASGG
jgi:MFS family permease